MPSPIILSLYSLKTARPACRRVANPWHDTRPFSMNRKLHVAGLSFAADAQKLQDHFAADGRKVASVQVMKDKLTGRSRGFGFVEMATIEDAQKAIAALDGKDFMGSRLTITEARG